MPRSIEVQVSWEVRSLSLLGLATITIIPFIFGRIPFKTKLFRSSQTVLDITTSFAGGLFLAFSIAYMLPLSLIILEDSLENIGSYPWPSFIVIGAFLSLLFLEKVILNNPFSFFNKDGLYETQSHGDHTSIETASNASQRNEEDDLSTKAKSLVEKPETVTNDRIEVVLNEGFIKECSQRKNYANFLFTGLCFKSFLTGLTLGVQDRMVRVVHLSIAIMLYKWAESLSVGVAFQKTNHDWKKARKMLAFFALMPACGYAVGMMITGFQPFFLGILLSVLTGVIFYVATIDILQEAFEIKEYVIWKFFSVVLGIAFVLFLDFLEFYGSL